MQILVAVNTMTTLASSVTAINSEVHIRDLDWVLVGEVTNNGATTLIIPNVGTGTQQVNYMIRTGSGTVCSAFDYVAKGTMQSPLILPMASPTRPAANVPTTMAPTAPTQPPIFVAIPSLNTPVVQSMYTCVIGSDSRCNEFALCSTRLHSRCGISIYCSSLGDFSILHRQSFDTVWGHDVVQ